MDAVLRNIWVRMCCCWRLPSNTIQTINTGGGIQRLLKMNIITLRNSLQVHVKFRVRKKVFIYFILYIYLKRMGLNLSTYLPIFVHTFRAMWRHRPLKEYSVFVGIRAASTFLSLYTLDGSTPLRFHKSSKTNKQPIETLCNFMVMLLYNYWNR